MRRKPKPVGHVARDIKRGRRPFLTCTVAPETFAHLDRLAETQGTSRGRIVDVAIATLADVSTRLATRPEADPPPEASPESENAS